MEILIKPLITEKMTAKTEKLNQYGFIVDKRANKFQIKAAIEELYNITVEEVNTMVYIGKKKFRGTKKGWISGRTNSFKKAIVKLKDGDVIDFYSNV